MEAIYRPDGTIKEVYDEKDHRHPGLLTVRLTEEQFKNPEAYRVDPEKVELYLVPTCEKKYIVTEKTVMREMTKEEKATVDAEEARIAALPPPEPPVDRVKVLEDRMDELTAKIDALTKAVMK